MSPESRVFGGILVFCSTSAANGILGLLAWWLRDWQNFLRVACGPAIILGIIYIFTLPESFRWLLSKGQNVKVAQSLLKVAKVNRIYLNDSLSETLTTKSQNILLDHDENQKREPICNLKEIFQYPKFCLRIAMCAYCWLTNVLVFYGLSFNAVAIGGNKFSNYTAVSFIEVPATFFVIYAANRIGRRYLLIGAYFSSGISLLVLAFLPTVYEMKLALYLIGKFSIAVSFSTLYTFTSEIFPTNCRHTLFGFCSGFGRIGSIIATQASLLQATNRDLGMLLFSTTALTAGLLSFTFPETLNIRFPDTVKEAMSIGKNRRTNSEQQAHVSHVTAT